MKNKRRSIKAQLLNLFKKEAEFDPKLMIINNGEKNIYPEKIDRFVNNSVTARSCARKMVNYLVGRGFEDNELKVGKVELLKFATNTANSIVRQYGVYINYHYDANFEISSVKVLPYTNMRKGKKDDEDYNGKFAYYKDWGETNVNPDEIKWFHTYNPKKEIVEAQVLNEKGNSLAEKLKNYNGQVKYINLTDDYEYALSLVEPVMYDCDSEAQSSLFKNKSIRRGFFGKTLVVTPPLSGSLEDYPNEVEWQNAVSERENFKRVMEDMLGAENTGDMAHIEQELRDGERIDDIFQIKDISSNVNDKMFEYTESSTFKNILMAFNSVPPALIRPENSIFSASGESINAMKLEYMNNTEFERQMLQNIINKVVKAIDSEFYDARFDDFQLIPIIDANNQE